MEFNIMTWNVDWFRNGNRSEQEDKYCVKDCSEEAYGKIIGIVKPFLEKENAVVFLQEVPYKYKDGRWYEHSLYAQLLKDFPKEDYDIFMNDNNGRSCCLRYTLAISKKGVYAVNNTTFCPYNNKTGQVNNRMISVKKDPIVLFGVHMPVLKNNKTDIDNIKMWDDIIQYAQQVKNLIIAGDFNAYVGCRSKETDDKYCQLLKSMQECVPADKKTFGNNRIDNILISKGTLSENCKYDVEVRPRPDEEKYSDHKYVTMKLTIKD